MKVYSLTAENVKRLRSVALAFDEQNRLTVVGGKNGNGKTSLLDAIMYALGGMDHVPGEPLRRGAEHGESTVVLGENGEPKLKVTRTFGADRASRLVVETPDGMRPRNPQALLDSFLGALTFDPLAFVRMDPKAQRETLRRLVGLDFSGLDAKRSALFQERTAVNRQAKALEARLAGMPEHADAPAGLVVVAELVEELEAAQAIHAEADEAERVAEEWRRDIGTHEQRVSAAKQRVSALERQLAEARESVVEQEKLLAAQREGTEKAVAAAAEARASLPDLDPIRERIAAAEGVNAKVRANAARQELALEAGAAVSEAEKLTKAIEQLDFEKREALAGASFPVPGLSFDESGVTLGGIPFDQASSAEQLRVSLAIGAAMNPKLRLVLIRDGSLLDDDSLADVARIADEMDLQVLLERVGEDAHTTVVIEDGAVRASGEAAA